MGNTRRKARKTALQVLYEADCVGHPIAPILQRMGDEQSLSKESTLFVEEIASGVVDHMNEIDAYIQKFAPSFPVSQISIIDRTILRIAIYEIVFHKQVSVQIAINEAVELAKSFGSSNSPKFVNGVLGSISSMMIQK